MKNPNLDSWKCRQGIDGLGLWLAAALCVALLVVPSGIAQGCPMCEAAVDGAIDPLAKGLNISILFLMAMPFILTGSVGGWFFYMYRRTRRQMPALRLVQAAKEGIS
jgi:hypothetical protein